MSRKPFGSDTPAASGMAFSTADVESFDDFDLRDLENEFTRSDENFRSELDYDGYQNIEDYDNSVYNSCNLDETEDYSIGA
jgi:hypothetical protein